MVSINVALSLGKLIEVAWRERPEMARRAMRQQQWKRTSCLKIVNERGLAIPE